MPIHTFRVRRATAVVAGAVSALLLTGALSAPAALADDSTTLTVVGTSDVNDSGLINNVIKPDFQQAYPSLTLNYVSLGTGAAIAYAEQGSASALLVHAPSLENQFVASGYSLNNNPGNAFFYGDYVLLGPNGDPASVGKRSPHNVVAAFERIASQGAAGKANYVSRGGTPGTTVQEHAIWALTTGVTTCQVSAANGGGASPSTVTGPCPSPIPYPSWYHTTGLTQGPNIVNADACNYPTASTNNCYVLTDRGTFDYLQSMDEAQNLKIVTQNNSPNAPGGISILANSFHGYAVNPDQFSGSTAAGINTVAAQEFLNFVTSAPEQMNIGNYLSGATGGAPFLPDAAPAVTASAPAASSLGGNKLTIGGNISNVVPGTPALANEPVNLIGTDNESTPVTTTVASTTTDSQGNYKFQFVPTASMTYTISVPQITQVEYPTLSPPFSDILVATTRFAGSNTITARPLIKKVVVKSGALDLFGTLAPPPGDSNGSLTLYARINGSGDPFTDMGEVPLTAGRAPFNKTFPLPAGTYNYYVTYSDAPFFNSGNSPTRTSTVS